MIVVGVNAYGSKGIWRKSQLLGKEFLILIYIPKNICCDGWYSILGHRSFV